MRLRNSKLVPQKVKYTALVVFGYYLEGKECTVFFFFLVEERNRCCFDEKCSSVEVVDWSQMFVASWVFMLPAFRGLSMDTIILKWRDWPFHSWGAVVVFCSVLVAVVVVLGYF